MAESIKARCDECGNDFIIEEFQTTTLPNDIEKTFFTCSHCNHEYVSFYTNKKIRMMQGEMRQLLARSKSPKLIERKRQSIKVEMDKLKEMMNADGQGGSNP